MITCVKLDFHFLIMQSQCLNVFRSAISTCICLKIQIVDCLWKALCTICKCDLSSIFGLKSFKYFYYYILTFKLVRNIKICINIKINIKVLHYLPLKITTNNVLTQVIWGGAFFAPSPSFFLAITFNSKSHQIW